MPPEKQIATDPPAELAQRITEALLRERVVPRFVDSYVVENSRHALQVHASLYRDLLELLQREALLALTVRALAIVCNEPRPAGKSKPRPMLRRDATAFRRRFLASLTRQQGWTVGDALDFQRDLQVYEELLARAAAKRRRGSKNWRRSWRSRFEVGESAESSEQASAIRKGRPSKDAGPRERYKNPTRQSLQSPAPRRVHGRHTSSKDPA